MTSVRQFHKHSNIRTHSIPNCISYTQHCAINVINTAGCSIAVHSDIKYTAITVCKSNNRVFNIFNVFSFEFSCFVLYEHKVSLTQFKLHFNLTIITIIFLLFTSII